MRPLLSLIDLTVEAPCEACRCLTDHTYLTKVPTGQLLCWDCAEDLADQELAAEQDCCRGGCARCLGLPGH
jgi:hypothetical protein